MKRLGLLCFMSLSAACLPGAGFQETRNTRPVARALWPQLVTVGVGFDVDARESSDADADALTFVLQPGDGTADITSDDGVVTVTLNSAGAFEMQLQVEDGQASTRLTLPVIVVGDEPRCDCDLPCIDDGTAPLCIDGVCLNYLASDEGERLDAEAALVCLP